MVSALLSELPLPPELRAKVGAKLAPQDFMVEALKPIVLPVIQLIGEYLSLIQRLYMASRSPCMASSLPNHIQATLLPLSQRRWRSAEEEEGSFPIAGFEYPLVATIVAEGMTLRNLESGRYKRYAGFPEISHFIHFGRLSIRSGLTVFPHSDASVGVYSFIKKDFLPMQVPQRAVQDICLLSEHRLTTCSWVRSTGTLEVGLWDPELTAPVHRETFSGRGYHWQNAVLLGRWVVAQVGDRDFVYDIMAQIGENRPAQFSRMNRETVFRLQADEEHTCYVYRNREEMPDRLQVWSRYMNGEACLATVMLPSAYHRFQNNSIEGGLSTFVALFENQLLLSTDRCILSYNLTDGRSVATPFLSWRELDITPQTEEQREREVPPAMFYVNGRHLLALTEQGEMRVCSIEPKVPNAAPSKAPR